MTIESSVGSRLKHRREAVDISLRKLAQKTDLSASFISQVERGKANLSLNSLEKIADALEVPLLYFLSEESPYPLPVAPVLEPSRTETQEKMSYEPVIRADCRSKLILPMSGVTYELLVPNMGQKMVAITGRLAPGTDNIARRLREPSEEFIYVFSGTLLVELDTNEYYLNPNDSIYFEGNSLRKLACASKDQDAIWLSVITPAVF